MKKRPLQDILPPREGQSRSTERLAPEPKPEPRIERPTPYQSVEPQDTMSERTTDNRPGRFGFILHSKVWLLALGSLIALSFGFSFLFSGAQLSVVPRHQDVLVDGTFTAVKEAKASQLPFQVVTVTQNATKEVPATGEEKVERKASGKIVVYNKFSTAPQRLIKNTRFETPEGLVYRIDSSITVPGMTKKGTETIPGSVEVTVYADQPGEKYNIALTDFTIPGFKGSPQYTGFYGRSSSPMAGGAVGTQLVVAPATLTSTGDALKTQAETALASQFKSQVPADFYAFDKLTFIEFGDTQQKPKGNAVEITQPATLHAIIIKKSDLASHVAKQTIAGFEGGDVELATINGLVVTPNSSVNAKPWNADEVSFNLKGSTQVVWNVDIAKLQGDLTGRAKAALPTVLSGYPAIEKAKATFRPFWSRSFPDTAEDIKIVEEKSN